MAMLRWIWDGLKWLVKLVLPVFAKARDFRRVPPALRWFLHFLVIALILVGLTLLNSRADIPALLKGDVEGFVADYFLPLLFLLVYIISWLGWCLWKLWIAEEDEGAFPDIDAAWDEAVAALNKAGIELTEAPLVLILGRPLAAEDSLLTASQIPFTVRQAPARAEAPIRVFANRDGIYVTCVGASLLGRHAALLAGVRGAALEEPGDAEAPDFDPLKTLRPDEKAEMRQMQALLARAEKEGRSPAQLLDEERRELRVLTRKAQPVPSLLKDAGLVDLLSARLRYLCRLIVRDRHPYCPVNGMLLVTPFAAADDDGLADQTATIAQKDVTAARETLQVNCPLFALVADAETAPGFREFLLRFPEGDRQRRMGQSFPLMPDLDAEQLPAKIEESIGWVSQVVVPDWAYKFFRVERPGESDAATVIQENGQIYRFMSELRERRKRFGRILSRAAVAPPGRLTLFGGTYLAGTGASAAEQAFVAGFFDKVIRSQNAVSWTDESLHEEAAALRRARYGYVALAALAVGAAAAGTLFWLKWANGHVAASAALVWWKLRRRN